MVRESLDCYPPHGAGKPGKTVRIYFFFQCEAGKWLTWLTRKETVDYWAGTSGLELWYANCQHDFQAPYILHGTLKKHSKAENADGI
ncbi:hypothetical protein DPMN_184012 [Dreissena polymorpha]|uniref:Uncharacterized protein n=1 Tax=Dreissena polymorpha TaxID=45954 RepID=A0A9D4I620_DREPO|nr:hypothetical protein DPMN_184012 [Dreissena polymorpha]